MDILKTETDKIYHVVNAVEVATGIEFYFGLNGENRPQKRIVTGVIEQRKERGEYIDENKRRFWARIEQDKIV